MSPMRLLVFALFLSPALAFAQDAPFALAETDPPRQSTAALWADINGDGDLDLLFGDGQDQNGVYLGNGNGGFNSTRRNSIGFPFTDGVFADLDNDGDLDLAVGSLSRSGLMLNQNGQYVRTPSAVSDYNETRGMNAVDVNNDGNLDLFLVRRFSSRNVLLLGDGQGGFTRQPGPHETNHDSNGACWADFDADGDVDGFVLGSVGTPNELLVNENGVLTPTAHAAELPAPSSRACTWADVDRDGDLDLTVGSANGIRVFLQTNGHTFRLAPDRAFPVREIDVIGLTWGDVDNDGDLDLIAANRDESAKLYRNEGNRVTEIEILPELTSSLYFVAAALADYDRDGDLDLALPAGNTNRDDESYILANTSTGGNWLQVRLVGTASNREGIGALLEATATIRDRERVLVRPRQAKTGRRAQSGSYVHFGLGDAAEVTSLTVRWPSGAVQTVGPFAAGQFVEIVEPTNDLTSPVQATNASKTTAFGLEVSPNPARGAVSVRVGVPEAGTVLAEAFDVTGRSVWSEARTSEGGEQVEMVWNPGREVAAGSYVVRVRVGETVATRQVTIVR